MTRREAVRAYLAEQVAVIRSVEPAVRSLSPEVVHDVRVAVRRTRSALRIFDRLPGEEVVEPLRAWSDLLGATREPEALRETLTSVCPESLMAELAPALDAEVEAAGRAVVIELDMPAHRRLLEQLSALAVRDLDAPLRARRAARAAARKASKRLRSAGDDVDRLHRARKAAKRARYAAEAVGDVKTARHWKAVQNALGDHRDNLMAAKRLVDVPGEEAAAARDALAERAAAALARCPR